MKKAKVMDNVEGYLVVGIDECGDVVVNHPDLKPDANGVGHITFSPNQARNFAALLMKKSKQAHQPNVRLTPRPPNPLRPEPALLAKLGSIVVHAEEFLSVKGHPDDRLALVQLLQDPDIRAWIAQMGPFVPQKR